MEIIKPMDFSSFTAFCEHLNKSATAAASATTSSSSPSLSTSSTLSSSSSFAASSSSSISLNTDTSALRTTTPLNATTTTTPTTLTVYATTPPPMSSPTPPISSSPMLPTSPTPILTPSPTPIPIATSILTLTPQIQIDLNDNNCMEKMERQGKMEMAAKEREMQRLQCIPKKWNRREEYEFLRVLTGYGVDLHVPSALTPSMQSTTLAPDWTKFKQMAHLERKSDETLSDYYKVFIAMCKRQADVKLNENEKGLEGIIEDISDDHAKLILDRLELLSKLREIVKHPQFEHRINLCLINADTPDWWEAGKHDKELVMAILKQGLYRSETFIFNDPAFSFADSEKRFTRELQAQMHRSIKLDISIEEKSNGSSGKSLSTSGLLSSAPSSSTKNEIIDLDDELLTNSSLIKKENYTTLKNELKKEKDIKTEPNKKDLNEIEVTESQLLKELKKKPLHDIESSVANCSLRVKCEENKLSEKADSLVEKKLKLNEKEKEVLKTLESDQDDDWNKSRENVSKSNESLESTEQQDENSDVVLVDNDNIKITNLSEKNSNENKKAEYSDGAETKSEQHKLNLHKNDGQNIEIMPTNTEDNTETILISDADDQDIIKEKEMAAEDECKKQAAELKARFPDLEVIQPGSTKFKLDNPKLEMCLIRWFKDFALERRMYHIVTCVEIGRWPVDKNYSALEGCKTIELNICLHEIISHSNVALERCSTTPDVITITTDQGITKHLSTSQVQQVATAVITTSVISTPITNVTASSTVNIKANPAPPQSPIPPQLPIVTSIPTTASPSQAPILGNNLPNVDPNTLNAAMAAAVAAAGGNANALNVLLPNMSLPTLSGLTIPSSTNSYTMPSVPNVGTVIPNSKEKKRKRHIAIDVETERAKLHALLNSSQSLGPKDWETEIANMASAAAAAAVTTITTAANRRGTPSTSPGTTNINVLQPPPAHQHASLTRQSSAQFNKPTIPPLKTPPLSMGAPIDLSSSLPRMNMSDMVKTASGSGAIDLSEVQDFSMGSKKNPSTSGMHSALSSAFPSMSGKGGKLDDTLNKLMKKNNCIIEEPVVGKKEKRKKLDEILQGGFTSSKEQKTFPDPSLPSSKKPQIPPSVSVTPTNIQSSNSSQQQQQNQKPFTITVTTVPGKSKTGSVSSNSASSSSNVNSSNSTIGGLSALQTMAGIGGLSTKDSLNALLAQTMATDPQTFIKQQQKMMQCLPPAQRKLYESVLADMEQAMKMSAKYCGHDTKVNKWLTDMNSPLTDQLSMDYGVSASVNSNVTVCNTNTSSNRRSSRQQATTPTQQSLPASQMSSGSKASPHSQQSQQQSMSGPPPGLTGDEPVPVINKQTGKRLTGNKAPQLKRLMQWLTENPNYEVDPKWLEQMQNPMSAPSPKPMENTFMQSGKLQHPGRPSSTSSNTSTGSHSQTQQQCSTQSSSSSPATSTSKKSTRQSVLDQANAAMQFGSLAGISPSLLTSLPNLGAFDPKNPLAAFDPKNPLLSMPFAAMPGMTNLPGLGNLSNMNLFASLAGMSGLGNLATMDAQSLAALMAAAGPTLSNLGVAGNTSSASGGNSGKNITQSSSSKKSKNDAAQQSGAAVAAAMAALGGNPTSSGGQNTSSNAKNASAVAAATASQLAGFPFLFGNPSLLYPPMGLGSLNPYSLGTTGLGPAYDQLAQQYLMNGSSVANTTTTQTKAHQSKSNNSRSLSSSSAAAAAANSAANLMNAMAASMSSVQGTPSSNSSQSSSRGRQSAATRTAAQVSAEMAQLSNLLLPGADPHLLESFSRMAGIDLAQATRLMNSLGMSPVSGVGSAPGVSSSMSNEKRSSSVASSNAAAVMAAQQAVEKQAAKEQQKWMESLARGQLPTDLATLQALSQGKLPPSLTNLSSSNNQLNTNNSSTTSSSKQAKAAAAAAAAAAALPQIPGMSADFSQAFLAEMAAQAMAAAGGTLPLSGPGSLASLTGNLAGLTGGSSQTGHSSSMNASANVAKRQREQDALAKDAFKQQMDYYTKTLGLGSGISLIPTSSSTNTPSVYGSLSMGSNDDHHPKPRRNRNQDNTSMNHPLKDDLNAAAALAAAGLPVNFGGGMTSIEKSMRLPSSSNSTSSNQEVDKVTLTPLNSASIAANLPSQTTITIAPPISSGASSSSERSERSETRISLTITNAAEAAKMPPPYEEADELIIQPILKKSSSQQQQQTPPGQMHGSLNTSHKTDDMTGGNETLHQMSGGMNSNAANSNNNNNSNHNEETRRSSGRLKRPRSGVDHNMMGEQPPEKRRELRSTRHTRQSSGLISDVSLNLSTNIDHDDKPE